MMRSLSSGERRLVAVCSVIMLGILGMGLYRSGLETEPDWQIPEPKPTPVPNGYDLYVAAQTAIIPANPPVDQVNNPTLVTDPKVIATQYSLARRTAWLQANTKAWKLFERAKAADSLHPSERNPLAVGFGNYAQLRELARCKVIGANTAKMRGDWNTAAKEGLDIIEMGGDIKRGGPLLGFLVGAAIEAIGENSFRDTPAHLSGLQARHAAKRLEKLMSTRTSLADALREDRWVGLVRLRHIMRTQGWRRPSTWGMKASLLDQLKVQFLSQSQILKSYNSALDEAIKRAEQPYSANTPAPPRADNFVNKEVNPSFSRAKFHESRADTQLSLLLLRFALRAYRVEKGAYPTKLNQLAPTYLNTIPLDPFGNGTPLGYRKQGDSYLLWSIGPDGKDDKGKPIPPRGTRKIAMIAPDGVGDAIVIPEWE